MGGTVHSTRNTAMLAAWCAYAVICDPGHAQADPGMSGSKTRLALRSVAFYSDNFYYSAEAETAAVGAVVTPELYFLTQAGKLRLSALVSADYGAFDLPGSEDDYLDAMAQVGLALQPTLRNQFGVVGDFKRGHDPFGVDRTEDATAREAELDQWHRSNLGLRWRYGSPGARMNAQFGAAYLEKEYVTNEEATAPLSYDSTRVDYTLFYNYSEKTSALLDFSREDFQFDRSFGGVDERPGELYRMRLGAKWLATGKTSGDVRVGYRRRLFDTGGPDIEGLDWEAGIDWAPVPRTTLRLETAHSEQESYSDEARIIDVESAGLTVKHNLSSRLRASAALEATRADYDLSGRNDDALGVSAGAEYMAMSYLWVVGNAGLRNRQSSVPDRDYEQLNAFVGVRLGR